MLALYGPVNNERLADDVFARDETPVAAIQRIVAIVAHGEVGFGRQHHFTVHNVIRQHVAAGIQQRQVRLAIGKIIAERIGIRSLVNHVRLGKFFPVAVYLLVDDLDVIAGNAHYALYEGLADVHRIAEHDDIAVARVLIRQDVLADAARPSVSQLVHQQMIANQQRVLHGAGRNHETPGPGW